MDDDDVVAFGMRLPQDDPVLARAAHDDAPQPDLETMPTKPGLARIVGEGVEHHMNPLGRL